MEEKGDIRNPLKAYMGGPWALIFMAAASIIGVVLMLARRKRRRALAPDPVVEIDLERYEGLWYEIARIPTQNNLDCIGNTVVYTLKGDRFRVLHHCFVGSFDGPQRTVKGVLWPVDPAVDGRMKVRLGWNISSDYWIVDKDEEYNWTVILGPDSMRMRILSRQAVMPEGQYREILRGLRERGVDTSKLVPTPQPDIEPGQL